MNRLIETLKKWRDESEGKPCGLKEPAAYQRVIDEIYRINSKEAVNDEIKQRIENLTPIEELPKKGIHCNECKDCICYTCRRDNFDMCVGYCCKRHYAKVGGCLEFSKLHQCDDYVPEEEQ